MGDEAKNRGTPRAYPPELTRYVLEHWPGEAPSWLSEELFHEALATAYQASMTVEEARPARFRLLLTSPDALPLDGAPETGVLRLRFDHTRPLAVEELRRLAPATPFETSLIGAHVESGALRIWGVAHSGPTWLAPAWGGRSSNTNWTYDPIIHVYGPGRIAVRRAGVLIGALERGALVDVMTDVFDSAWLPAMFVREREEVRERLLALQGGSATPTAVEHSLVSRIAQHMLRRCIQIIRNEHHGGMLLIHAGDPASLPERVRLKYRFGDAEPASRYRAILIELLDALASSTTKASIGWEDFAANQGVEVARLERAVFEWSRVVANLAAVDGAVVLDKRFALLGFGAEVSSNGTSPARVWRALDGEGQRRCLADIEAVGTRHRAAYRFVQDHPGGLAIVVSHDGGVAFVASRDGEVIYWEQAVGP
jgi:hypothetical protein